MQNYNDLMKLVATLNDQDAAYSEKPTKAESARIRKSLNEIKKLVTPAKQDLIEADKG
jgi:hypothetical protein